MSDFNVRSDSVDVEQVMEQIRARIREKRGVDYTEQQLRDLAAVKLEKFLDPRGLRSDLLQRFKERQPQFDKPLLPLYTFEDTTIYETHRGPLRWFRKLLHPILKMLFNPNPIIHALHAQVEINRLNLEREETQQKRRIEMEALYYEIIHNLVFEMTRTGIEVKNLKMRVESLASRLEFNERRARALESVVTYKPSPEAKDERATMEKGEREPDGMRADARLPLPESRPVTPDGRPVQPGGAPEGPGQRSRRRRRRRGRRGGAPATATMGGAPDQGLRDREAPGGLPDREAPAAPQDQEAPRSLQDQEAPGVQAPAGGSGPSEPTAAAAVQADTAEVPEPAAPPDSHPHESREPEPPASSPDSDEQ